MKNYLVLVEAEDYINVDAENDEEAMEKAVDIFQQGSSDIKSTIVSSTEIEDEE